MEDTTFPGTFSKSETVFTFSSLPESKISSLFLLSPETSSQTRRLDGGARAWCTVAGSWFMMFATYGYLNSFGVYQDFYTRDYLSNDVPSKIAWIGSLQMAMPYALGLISGGLTDRGYFYVVVLTGSIIFSCSLFLLSLCKPEQYYQIFLSQGVGMGLGLGLTFVPSLSILAQHFERRQALASGIALSGSSVGAVIFPIILNNLIPKIGFAQAVRVTAFIALGCLIAANVLMRTNPTITPNVESQNVNMLIFFKDVPYILGVMASVMGHLGRNFPVFYLQLYAVQHGIGSNLAFYSLAILNASAAAGRIIGNFLADRYGSWILQGPVGLITSATIWAVLGANNTSTLIAVSVFYGFFSGAVLSLSVAGWNSMTRSPQEAGVRTGLAMAIGSIACLGAGPIQGALLTGNLGWTKSASFSGAMVFGNSILCFVVVSLQVKERGTRKV